MTLYGKVPKKRNFPTELANAVTGIRTSPTAPATTGYLRFDFEPRKGIADLAVSISLLLSRQKQSKGNQLFNFRLRPF
jgi:hypothetical protein